MGDFNFRSLRGCDLALQFFEALIADIRKRRLNPLVKLVAHE